MVFNKQSKICFDFISKEFDKFQANVKIHPREINNHKIVVFREFSFQYRVRQKQKVKIFLGKTVNDS